MHDDIQARMDAFSRAKSALWDAIDELSEENDQLRDRVDALETELHDAEREIELVNGTMNTPKQGEMEKLLAVIDYATNEATGGPAGKLVRTGEVAAAASCSRSNALRLMDMIAANFSWAEVKTPGGPKPKQLRVNMADTPTDDMRASIKAHYRDGATA